MLSSSSVIKGGNVKALGEKKIVVEYVPRKIDKKSPTSNEKFKDPYEKLASSIIENAKSESQEIIKNAYETSAQIQMECEQRGYSEGYEKGQENGYNDGYKKAMEEAEMEAKSIKDNAENLLKSAKKQYEDYLKQKTEDIKELIIEVVYNILKKEVESIEGFEGLIKETIKNSKNAKTLIIKCNDVYESELKDSVEKWKQSMGSKADIFVVPDNSLEKGKMVIDKDNGKVEIDIENSIEKVKDIIMNS